MHYCTGCLSTCEACCLTHSAHFVENTESNKLKNETTTTTSISLLFTALNLHVYVAH